MKKCIVIFLLIVAGCNTVERTGPTISDNLVKPPQKWIERYGDNKNAVIGFNVTLLLHYNNIQAEQIKKLGERITILEGNQNGKGKTKGKNKSKGK